MLEYLYRGLVLVIFALAGHIPIIAQSEPSRQGEVVSVTYDIGSGFGILPQDSVLWPQSAPDSIKAAYSSGRRKVRGPLLMNRVGSGRYFDLAFYSDGEFLALVHTFKGLQEIYRGVDKEVALYTAHIPFSCIKRDLSYGIVSNASDGDKEDLFSIVRKYGKKTAKRMCGAEVMVSYPVSLYDEKYCGRYTRCRALLCAKGGDGFILYFLMTEAGVNNFDEYVKRLKGMFKIIDNPENAR